jgi:N-acetyl-gamma-glutamyl-phosphate reductase
MFPNAKLDFVYSTTNAGVISAHHDLMGDIEMNFTDTKPECKCSFLVFGSW